MQTFDEGKGIITSESCKHLALVWEGLNKNTYYVRKRGGGCPQQKLKQILHFAPIVDALSLVKDTLFFIVLVSH